MSLFLIDQSIIEAFERVSQRIEYYTNLDNFFLARVVALLNLIFISINGEGKIINISIGLISATFFLVMIQRVEKWTRTHGGVNFHRLVEPLMFLRVFSLFFPTVTSVQIFKYPFSWLSDISIAVILYLTACSPLDPDKWDRQKKEDEARANFKHA